MVKFTEDPRLQAWIRLWAKILAACCAGVIVVVVGMLWSLNGFHGLGIKGATLVALLAGSVATMALGVALMGLVFYSNESRVDDDVRDASSSDDAAVS